ncbi:MAG: hypothetical protein ACPGN3_13835 [Opitutales bacterium]
MRYKALATSVMMIGITSSGFAQLTLELNETAPNSASSFTSTITYTEGVGFSSNLVGMDVSNTFTETTGFSFSFDVSIAGYTSYTLADSALTLGNTANILTRSIGWGVGGGDYSLRIDPSGEEGLLVTFDNFVGISEINLTGAAIGNPDSKAVPEDTTGNWIMNAASSDGSTSYDPIFDETFTVGSNSTYGVSFSETVAEGNSYFITGLSGASFRLNDLSFDGATAAIPEPSVMTLLSGVLALGFVAYRRKR